MDYKYVIIPTERLIVSRYTGELGLDETIESVKEMWANPLYSPEYRGIADVREINSQGSYQDIPKLIKFLNDPRASTAPWSVIVEEPRNTALMILLQAANALMSRIEIFSSWEAACVFHQVDVSESLFDALESEDQERF